MSEPSVSATSPADRGPVPEGCAPGTYWLVRDYFVANFLDGDDSGELRCSADILADTVAELFSNDHWFERQNQALMEALRRA